MADVDTPTCRAISAIVIPQSSTNLRETSALTAGISPRRLPLRNSVRETLRFLHSSAIKGSTFLPGQQLQNCTVGSCNHTLVGESFEKRDDYCIAMKRTTLQARIKKLPSIVPVKVAISTLVD